MQVATTCAPSCSPQHTGERRWHIAVPWLVGGVFMAVLPTVTKEGKQVVWGRVGSTWLGLGS